MLKFCRLADENMIRYKTLSDLYDRMFFFSFCFFLSVQVRNNAHPHFETIVTRISLSRYLVIIKG